MRRASLCMCLHACLAHEIMTNCNFEPKKIEFLRRTPQVPTLTQTTMMMYIYQPTTLILSSRLNHFLTTFIKSKECLNLELVNDLVNTSVRLSPEAIFLTTISSDSIIYFIKCKQMSTCYVFT